MKNTRIILYCIIALTLLAVIIVLPREDKVFSALGIKNTQLKVRQGLDLKGGSNLVYQADLSKTAPADKQKAVDGVVNVIEKRINPSGTSEITVRRSGEDRLGIDLPGVKDVNEAIGLIGKTAQLTFLRTAGGGTSTVPMETGLSGNDLSSATADIDPQSGKPIIRFEMKPESTQKFADLTTAINKDGGQLVILLDDKVLFNGGVSTPITDGKGQMEGFKDLKSAKDTTILLNAGALPVPIKLVEQRTVGATLGTESVARSILAGAIGLLLVIIFMIAYYRLAGVVAALALVIYTLLNLAYFKLSVFMPGFFIFSPIVLTLAGIAGFILSVGMAVDANILIFERMREEIRSGKTFSSGLEAGFDRAWTSIRDSNISTLITCIILYWFGASIIKGFAVTLALGVLLSMFTAIVVSRTLMRMLLRTKVGQDPKWYGIVRAEEKS